MTTRRATEQSVTVFCLMRPKPDRAEGLRDSLMALVRPTRAEAGCLAYDLYEEADGSLVLFETWRSPAELAAHQQQPAVQKLFGEQLSELLAEDIGVHQGALLLPAA